jgi:hypothetical protein
MFGASGVSLVAETVTGTDDDPLDLVIGLIVEDREGSPGPLLVV